MEEVRGEGEKGAAWGTESQAEPGQRRLEDANHWVGGRRWERLGSQVRPGEGRSPNILPVLFSLPPLARPGLSRRVEGSLSSDLVRGGGALRGGHQQVLGGQVLGESPDSRPQLSCSLDSLGRTPRVSWWELGCPGGSGVRPTQAASLPTAPAL